MGGITCRRCRDGTDELDLVDVLKDCVLGERSEYREGESGGIGVDTPSALASLASLAGAMGVRERWVLMGAEERRERGFGPVEGGFVVGTDVGLLAGCGFGRGRTSFRIAKEGTGAEVVQDIVVYLRLSLGYRLCMRQYRAEVQRWSGDKEWDCSPSCASPKAGKTAHLYNDAIDR